MRLLSLLFLALPLLSSTVRADDDVSPETLPNTRFVTLHKWPLSVASPIPLGTVGYNPQTRTGDYKVAKAEGDAVGDDEVVRVGVWDGKEGWFGCVTTGVSCLASRFSRRTVASFIYPSRRMLLLTKAAHRIH